MSWCQTTGDRTHTHGYTQTHTHTYSCARAHTHTRTHDRTSARPHIHTRKIKGLPCLLRCPIPFENQVATQQRCRVGAQACIRAAVVHKLLALLRRTQAQSTVSTAALPRGQRQQHECKDARLGDAWDCKATRLLRYESSVHRMQCSCGP